MARQLPSEWLGSIHDSPTMLQLALFETAARGSAAGPDLTQYFAVCVGLIALIVIGGFAFKRLFARALTSRAARRSLQIIDVLPLGGKQRLAVVRCYDRSFIVGLGDKELCLVAELDAQANPELGPAAVEPLATAADQNAFQRLLRAARPRPPARQPAASPADRRMAPEGLLG